MFKDTYKDYTVNNDASINLKITDVGSFEVWINSCRYCMFCGAEFELNLEKVKNKKFFL